MVVSLAKTRAAEFTAECGDHATSAFATFAALTVSDRPELQLCVFADMRDALPASSWVRNMLLQIPVSNEWVMWHEATMKLLFG